MATALLSTVLLILSLTVVFFFPPVFAVDEDVEDEEGEDELDFVSELIVGAADATASAAEDVYTLGRTHFTLEDKGSPGTSPA